MSESKAIRYITFLKRSLFWHAIAFGILLYSFYGNYTAAVNYDPSSFPCSPYLDFFNGLNEEFIWSSLLVYIPFGFYSLFKIRHRVFTWIKLASYLCLSYLVLFTYWTSSWCDVRDNGDSYQGAVVVTTVAGGLGLILVLVEYWFYKLQIEQQKRTTT